MPNISPSYLQLGSTIGAIVLALLTIFIRLKASNKPVTIKKIIIPPLGMSTGFLMFVVPVTHIPLWWALVSFIVGWFIFSYPLIRSTHFKKIEDLIYAERSRSFIVILFGLLVIRTALHQVIEQHVSIAQSGALFFLLAFGMILRWRLFMYKEFKQLTRN
ncbi:CcdC family protein [Paenibacillus sp. IHBB 10380]|uniref:CcdC family protein n=1 Tax=Paenibacillus sp. IHBB 10380 TaxID=1566358 RepID=UPI0005CF9727|nr:cytochrome c biogenesis protein CcdC [Paenibacillus sp. IHBB 10380]AJS61013.1 membrane protein [Paenibacillus sp. IHBB 10380]